MDKEATYKKMQALLGSEIKVKLSREKRYHLDNRNVLKALAEQILISANLSCCFLGRLSKEILYLGQNG